MSLKPSIRVDKFNAGGAFTWNKFLGAKYVIIQLIGGGGGGGNGAVSAPGSTVGVAAGAGGGYGELFISAAQLGTTEVVNVGAGGAAGADGGESSFGKYIFVRGGKSSGLATAQGAGYPGSSVSATQNGLQQVGGSAGSNGTNGGAGTLGAGGGGSGGGSSSAIAAIAPGAGGGSLIASVVTGGNSIAGAFAGQVGGLLGAPNGGNGIVFVTDEAIGGAGGGGGALQIAGNGGTGGNGAKPGGGGGGGGNAFTGFTAGAGGAGADGLVIVTTYF